MRATHDPFGAYRAEAKMGEARDEKGLYLFFKSGNEARMALMVPLSSGALYGGAFSVLVNFLFTYTFNVIFVRNCI